jgi:hypothetical protein
LRILGPYIEQILVIAYIVIGNLSTHSFEDQENEAMPEPLYDDSRVQSIDNPNRFH